MNFDTLWVFLKLAVWVMKLLGGEREREIRNDKFKVGKDNIVK
jgi:hypothetical protein